MAQKAASTMGQVILKLSNRVDGSSNDGNERLKGDNDASATMMYQALFRYVGSRHRDPEIRTNDHLGVKFLPRFYRAVLAAPGGAALVRALVERGAPGLYGFSCCRSLLGDAAFLAFLAAHRATPGGCQIVNLSGGFCSRFERYRPQLERHAASCCYLELDFPSSQALKVRLAARARFGPPASNYHRMEIDYLTQTLGDVLLPANNAASPYDPAKPTLVLWEGVSMYLEAAAVDAVLAFFRRHTAPGSRLQFDACDAAFVAAAGRTGGYGDRKLWDACAAKGEPLKMGIPTDRAGAGAYFADRGYRFPDGNFEVNHYGASKLEAMLKGKHRVLDCIHYFVVENLAIDEGGDDDQQA
jgi:methyltransferase (TIGR00027 family)